MQNAVDAVDEGYQLDPISAIVKIDILIDATRRSITITDTGTGMPWDILRSAPSPNTTYKRRDISTQTRSKPSRGEKGVGLSFLTFACNYLRVKTCDGTKTIEVTIEGANDWVHERIDTRPVIKPTTSEASLVSKELGSIKYTQIEMIDIKSQDYSDQDIFDLSLPEIIYTLRTKTAVGHTDPVIFDRTPEPNIQVSLSYIDKEGNKKDFPSIPYSYLSPEEFLEKGSKITFERFNELLKHDRLNIAQGKALIHRTQKTTSGGRSIACYVFSMAPKAFDDITKDRMLEDGWAPDKWSGILVATRGMPTGIYVEHPTTYSAGYWQRIFMLLQDDEMNFDVGRKTLQGRAKPMIQEIARELWNDILVYLNKLTPADAESVTRYKRGKLLQLFQQAQQWPNLDYEPVQYMKQPQREQMVVALFYELVGAGIIKGYRTLRNNTLDQYDAFMHYNIDKRELGRLEAVAARTKGAKVEDLIIVEFKYGAEDILGDLLENTKRYQDINLLVCWELDIKKFEEKNISVELIPSDSVYYFGSTHWLYFPGIYQAGDRLAVIELKKFIEQQKENKA